jgi:SAM-dependent methyltransferase
MEVTQTVDNQYQEISRCGACHFSSLEEIYDFGTVPIAGYFPNRDEPLVPKLPMRLLKCVKCTLFQITPDISDKYLFTNYRYVSSIGTQRHFDELAKWFQNTLQPKSNSRILEIGCNDGPLLNSLSRLGFNPIGIDPAINIVQEAQKRGHKVINDFFGPQAILNHRELVNFDYIFSSNSFAHIFDINSIAESIGKALLPGGMFIVEVQSMTELLKHRAFDFIYHEHKYYYTLRSISNLMSRFGLHLRNSSLVSAHGGSYRLTFEKGNRLKSKEIQETINSEDEYLQSINIVQAIEDYRKELAKSDDYIAQAFKDGKRIIGFGASGRGNMLLSNLPKSRQILSAVMDESPERIGRKMSQHDLSVVDFREVNHLEVDVVLIIAWNYAERVISRWRNCATEFIVPLPKFNILRNDSNKN